MYTPLAKWTASDASIGLGISKSWGTRWHCFSNCTRHVTFPLMLQSSSKNQAPSLEVKSTSCSPALDAAPSIIRFRLDELWHLVRQPACYCILHIKGIFKWHNYVISNMNASKKISQEATHLVSAQRAEMITLAKLSEPSSPFSWRKTFMQRSISFSCSSQTGTVTASCFKRSTCLISLLFISAA